MDRRTFVIGSFAGLSVSGLPRAQTTRKTVRIGYLQGSRRSAQVEHMQSFEAGLRERGYTLGRDIE